MTRVELSGSVTNHSSSSSAKVEKAWQYRSIPMVCTETSLSLHFHTKHM